MVHPGRCINHARAMTVGWQWGRQGRVAGCFSPWLDRVNEGCGRRWGPTCDVQSLLRGCAAAEGFTCGPDSLPVSTFTASSVAERHIYAEDIAWLYGSDAMLAMASSGYRRVANMPSTTASMETVQWHTSPAELMYLWAYLARHCPDAHRRQDVWELRLATLLLNSLTDFLWGQVERAAKGRPRCMSNVAIHGRHTTWSWVYTDVVSAFLGSDTCRDLSDMLRVDDASLVVFHKLCQHATSAASAWTRLGAMLVHRVDLANRRRVAAQRIRTHRFSC
jgi:hypothetical protein